MEFNSLNNDQNCDCTEDAKEDTTNLFAMKTMKSELRLQDFNSYWEKGRKPQSEDCSIICSHKGVSISIFTDQTKEEVTDAYRALFPLAPKYKPFLSIIRFYESAGLVKHTPNENNRHHFDFFKCDSFDFSKVVLITINELH